MKLKVIIEIPDDWKGCLAHHNFKHRLQDDEFPYSPMCTVNVLGIVEVPEPMSSETDG